MAPRNNDASTSSYKKNFPVEDSDIAIKDIVPCLLHKKHKVVKLVKSQMQKINEEGLLCGTSGTEIEEVDVGFRRLRRGASSAESGVGSESRYGSRFGFGSERFSLMMCYLCFLPAVFVLILLMVWISAGPLSNTIAHTPVPLGSFVQTEGPCSLEKKYLLRWSKPEYFE